MNWFKAPIDPATSTGEVSDINSGVMTENAPQLKPK
eukprot:CAMPEP_0205832320 /NCGR_PEP_ID=MMETSP0206-20130828/46642_1 /ASSEMBLY_ACC=CAM_ASM_000279 /TAXON_ID=36767 /ORGANISM="Euplotes focardii, Strain TN1" /LENGTH=35 /DNA_ID= /DNA_START= /DNA_END= /DNA_ORIENTATION=